MRHLIYIIAVACALLFTACGLGERDYSRWESLPPSGWLYTDTVVLLPVDTSLTDNDSIVDGAVKVALRHSNDYPYSNIWLELTYSGEGRMMRDTINLRLADVYGRWHAMYRMDINYVPYVHCVPDFAVLCLLVP